MATFFRCHGTVMANDHDPAQGAYVTVLKASVRIPELAIVTDANGQFELTLPVGAYTLGATLQGRMAEVQFEQSDASPLRLVMALPS